MIFIYFVLGALIYCYLIYKYGTFLTYTFLRVLFLPQVGFYYQYHSYLEAIPFWIFEGLITLFVLPWNLFGLCGVALSVILYAIWQFLLELFRKR